MSFLRHILYPLSRLYIDNLFHFTYNLIFFILGCIIVVLFLSCSILQTYSQKSIISFSFSLSNVSSLFELLRVNPVLDSWILWIVFTLYFYCFVVVAGGFYGLLFFLDHIFVVRERLGTCALVTFTISFIFLNIISKYVKFSSRVTVIFEQLVLFVHHHSLHVFFSFRTLLSFFW